MVLFFGCIDALLSSTNFAAVIWTQWRQGSWYDLQEREEEEEDAASTCCSSQDWATTSTSMYLFH